MGDGRRHVFTYIQVGAGDRNQAGIPYSVVVAAYKALISMRGSNVHVSSHASFPPADLSHQICQQRLKRPEKCGSGELQLFTGFYWSVFLYLPSSPCLGFVLWWSRSPERVFTPASADENSNQSFLSDVYHSKMDNSSSASSSQQVSPPHTSLRTDDSQPPMLGQESVDGMSPSTVHSGLLYRLAGFAGAWLVLTSASMRCRYSMNVRPHPSVQWTE